MSNNQKNPKKYNSSKKMLADLKANGWVSLKNVFTKNEVLNLEKEINYVSKKMSGYNFQTAIKKFYIKDKKKLF